MKKITTRFIAFLLLIITITTLTSCAQEKTDTLNQRAVPIEIFSDIGGKNMAEYFESYQIPSNSNSYLKSNNISMDTLKQQLTANKKLELFKAELGGTPYIIIESIKLVGDRWIYCTAEDGHISAELLIKFEVIKETNEEELSFAVFARDINGEGTKIVEQASQEK